MRTSYAVVRGFNHEVDIYVMAENAEEAEKKALAQCNVSVQVVEKEVPDTWEGFSAKYPP